MDEPMLLGEPLVAGQSQLHPSPFDRHELGTERRHHRLPGEARSHPRLHRRDGLRLLILTTSAHQPILPGRRQRGGERQGGRETVQGTAQARSSGSHGAP
jgi:hypothetical protein